MHPDCHACGASIPTGLKLRFVTDAQGAATADWQPSPAHQSYPDRLHGGVVATLLDAAMVHALFAKGVAGVTAELKIRYTRPVSTRSSLRVTGFHSTTRRGIFDCHAEIHQNGSRVVRADAKFMEMPDASAPC